MKLNIQLFADGKVVIDTQLNTKNFESGLSKMQSVSQKAGSSIKSIVAGLGITKLIGKAMSEISSSVSGAITRLDTLNNFPKVMSNLGISAEESRKSIDKMSDELAGLPTTLDAGARAVQRFTSKNSDVAKSTDLFLALNNAILAGGASSDIQASALEQLSQAYAKGKPDMMEWRTAMTAMPAQLKQVAKAMGYVDADKLGEALRDGTVSMDEFMDTITKLNKEGIDGFQSFEKQARNSTGGIRTSITVARTQIVKGVADIMKALDVKLEKLGFGKLSEIIENVGKGAKKSLDNVAKLIAGDTKKIITDELKKLETTGPKMIKNLSDGIKKEIPKFANTAGDIITQFVQTLNANLPQIIQSGIDIATTLINSIAEQIPKLLPQVIKVLMTTFMEIMNQENLDKIAQAGVNLVLKLIEGILRAIPELLSNTDFMIKAFLNIISGGQFLVRKLGWALLKALVKGLIEALPNLAEAGFKIIKTIIDKITSLFGKIIDIGKKIVNKIIEGIKGGFKGIKEAGGNLISGLWDGIKSKWEKLKGKAKSLGGSIVSKFKEVFGIHSPSRVFRDEIGKYLAQGIDVGFEDEISKVYSRMQKSINLEQGKLQANVKTGRVFNTLQNTTPIKIELQADVEMEAQKVGRIITPHVSRTIKTGGGYQ